MTSQKKPIAVVNNKVIGANRDKRRLWIEGSSLMKAGFERGDRYSIAYKEGAILITIEKDDTGPLMVSGRNRGGKALPIIDINTKELADYLAGTDADAPFQMIFHIGHIVIKPAE